jgi:hypothetical protein
MEYMWIRTSRIEAEYMGGVYVNLDFNRMTNPLGSTQTDHTQCLQAAKLTSEILS